MRQAPGWVEPDGQTRLEPRQYLARMGSTDRDNPDDTPLGEAVELIRKFKKDSENSEIRQKAMRWWRKCDRFVEGEQWDEDVKLKSWQAKLTINKLHKIRLKWLSLLLANIPKVEFAPRDAGHAYLAGALDGYFEHEWERNKWTTTIGIVLKQALTHGIGWLKIYWDVHGDGGRGNVRLEPVSNYDLFLDEKAIVRDGKLYSKSLVHTFELSRNQILSLYGEDVGGQIPSSADQILSNSGDKPPKSTFQSYVDDLNTGESVRGRGAGTGATGRTEGHPDRANTKDTYEVNECLFYDDSRIEGPEIDDAVGDVPPLMYPNGRIMTESNGVLLYDQPNELGFNNFVPFCLSPDVERIYNPSTIYHCISPQEELNKRRSQIADHAAMTGNPILVVSANADIDETFVPHPGATVTTMDTSSPTGGIFFLEAPPMSPEVVQSSVMSEQTIEEVSGLEEIEKGSMPNDLESGVGVDLVQQASSTVPNMFTMFVDDSIKTTCEYIASLILDFTSDERKYRFLDTRALEMGYASFNPAELLLPSREQAVMAVEQEIAIFHQQIQLAEQQMSPMEVEELVPYIMQEIEMRQDEIEQIWALPASDLISFDIKLKVGTRELTKLSQQSLSLQMYEMDGITLPRLMQDLEYHNWMMAYQEKMQERQELADAEAEAMEEQLEIEREIDEDEHEQDLEIEKLKGKFKIQDAEIRARATARRAMQAQSKKKE